MIVMEEASESGEGSSRRALSRPRRLKPIPARLSLLRRRWLTANKMQAQLLRIEDLEETALSSHDSARYLSAHRESQRSDDMNDQKLKRRVTSPAEREALKVFGQVKTETPVSEHEKAQKAFHQNRERLKALRLAREATEKAKGT
jgi:hypothetical protein